jgi:NDP-sugar pyrophosphorylase family protein
MTFELAQTAGIVLVGAHRWTNSAFDALLPRPLLPVGNRPLVSYALAWLNQRGIGHAVVCGNRDSRTLRAHLEGQLPLGLTVTYQEDRMPRGAAGSARDAVKSTPAETFVVSDGNAIPTVDLESLLAHHHASGACVTVVVHDEDARSSNQIPSGIYVFSRRAFDFVPEQGYCDIKESLIPALHRAGERVVAYEAASATPRVLDSFTYMAVNEWMAESIVAGEHADYARRGQALVHREAFVAADASLVGAVLVAPGATIMSGAVVLGPTTVGRDARIEEGAFVSRSAIWRRAVVGRESTVERCIVADDARVAAGSNTLRGIVSPTASGGAWAPVRRHLSAVAGFSLGHRLARVLFGPKRQPSSVLQ